jgi:hypothetical protein
VAELNQAAYLAQNPDVAGAVLNEQQYLADNPDVAAAVARGETTASKHFQEFGRAEGRTAVAVDPNAPVDVPFADALEHYQLYGQFENRQGTSQYVEPIQVQQQQIQQNELIGQQQLGPITPPTPQAVPLDNLSVPIPTPSRPDLGKISETKQVAPQIGQMTAAQTAVTKDMLVDPSAVQGQLSAGAFAQAAQGTVSQEATVSYQLSELMKALDGTGPMPAWASPAIRKVTGIMNARGVGSSSMAAAAMTQAAIEAGVPIAAADAQTYAQMDIANLNARQQAALQNAVQVAAMDKMNLDNRMRAAVNNAQTFLGVDIKNLDNEQSAEVASYQSYVQGLFTDVAAENARIQLNARNEVQVEEFFAELGSQVEASNKNRVAAQQQFNVAQNNAMQQFNSSMITDREKFNANMRFAIDQSNVAWRRQVNTVNTAAQNTANMQNAQNLFGLSMAELGNEWQTARDIATWNFTTSENAKDRALSTALAAMQIEGQLNIAEKNREWDATDALGQFGFDLGATVFKNLFEGND